MKVQTIALIGLVTIAAISIIQSTSFFYQPKVLELERVGSTMQVRGDIVMVNRGMLPLIEECWIKRNFFGLMHSCKSNSLNIQLNREDGQEVVLLDRYGRTLRCRPPVQYFLKNFDDNILIWERTPICNRRFEQGTSYQFSGIEVRFSEPRVNGGLSEQNGFIVTGRQ